jgi:hypothetical protein
MAIASAYTSEAGCVSALSETANALVLLLELGTDPIVWHPLEDGAVDDSCVSKIASAFFLNEVALHDDMPRQSTGLEGVGPLAIAVALAAPLVFSGVVGSSGAVDAAAVPDARMTSEGKVDILTKTRPS